MSEESRFNGLYVEGFLEIPTTDNDETVKFRVNIETSGLEFYNKQKNKWISNSLIDLSFENGLADILAVDDNFLYDTFKYDDISIGNDVLNNLKYTWTGKGGEGVISNIDKMPFDEAIIEWNLPVIELDNNSSELPYILKVSIINNSQEDYSFLQQSNINIIGPHQVRSFVFCEESNNSFLTDNYLLSVKNEWEYITLRNDNWNPRVKAGGICTFYLFLPYVSSGWHGYDKVVWRNNNGNIKSGKNIQFKFSNSNCILTDNYKSIMSSNIDLPEIYLTFIKKNVIDDLYKHLITVIEYYHVNNIPHSDLIHNRFSESITYENDRNVNVNLNLKYPFLINYSKEHNNTLVNLSSIIKSDVCTYKHILRESFLQYSKSIVILNELTTLDDLKSNLKLEKNKIYNIAKEVYESYE